MSKYSKQQSGPQKESYTSRGQDGRFMRADQGFGQSDKGFGQLNKGIVETESGLFASATGTVADSGVTWELPTTRQPEYVDPYLYEIGFFESPEEREKLLASTPIEACAVSKAE